MEDAFILQFDFIHFIFWKIMLTCGANVEQTEGCCKMKNLASALISAACEILNCFERYPEPREKVYANAKGSTRPRLLYNFDIKEGNTVRCGVEGNVFCCLLDKDEKPATLLGFQFNSYLKVERIDTITYQEQSYRRFTLTFLDAYHEPLINDEDAISGNVVWIEGVGSGAGPFSPWVPLPTEGCIYIGCELNKEYLYTDFYGSSEPAGIGKIQQRINSINATYDLRGSRLPSLQGVARLPKGVYIQNGKKVMIK